MGWQGRPLATSTPTERSLIATIGDLEREVAGEMAHADRLAAVLRAMNAGGVYEDEVDAVLAAHEPEEVVDVICLFRWFWRGVRARSERSDADWCAAVDQEDEDAWLRSRGRHPSGGGAR